MESMLRFKCLFIIALLQAVSMANMNGPPGAYKIANGNPSALIQYSTDYTAEYIEVYSPPIKTQYAEVYWRDAGPVPLPDAFQKRYLNKSVAIIGYEVAVVEQTGSGDVPVPMNSMYNHHFEASIINSRHVKVVKRQVTPEIARRIMSHGRAEILMPEVISEPLGAEPEASLVHAFYMANGGEARLSYKGLPKGYAQVLHSPDTLRLSPMMVDTKNRDQQGPVFMPGPLPRSAQAPPNASYSGLLECPCSTRLKKEWKMVYSTLSSGTCPTKVANASECFMAGRMLIDADQYSDRTVSSPSLASACSLVNKADGTVDVIWNLESAADCGTSEAEDVMAFVAAHVNLTLVLSKHDGPKAARITISGPADKWLGVGFGTNSMCIKLESDTCPRGGPYAIVVTGDRLEDVEERRLDFHGPGRVIQSSIDVVRNTVRDGVRTVVITRGLKGATADYYTFDPSTQSLPIINAIGCSLTFAQHCGHGPASLNFVSADVPSCVCRSGVRGTIGGNAFPDCACAGDLFAQHNPTCYVSTYVGGLACCRHGQSLLDEDQVQPWAGDYQTVHLKFRFYFEDYVQVLHKNTVWLVHISEPEYDIVPCLAGTPSSQCVQVVTARWTVASMMQDCSTLDNVWCTGIGSSDPKVTEGVKLIRINPHCHAPHCLSMELYNADTGHLLCYTEPIRGTGSELDNEKDYINIPPCIWGDPDQGLLEPPHLPLGTSLMAIHRANNTHGHTGEMGHWQMRAVLVPKAEPDFRA